jgi:hypothetical protein
MTHFLHGKTIAHYGNPVHQHTLAGATILFFTHPQLKDAPTRTKFSFASKALDGVGGTQVGRALVAEDGTFKAVLEGYRGGPIIVALSVEKFNYAPATGKKASGILGAFSPQWDKSDEGSVAAVSLDLARQDYCALLEALDLWLVAGRVTDCKTKKTPLIGATINGYDRDLTQDDHLGATATDSTGSFSLFFQSAAFKGIPLLPPPFDVVPPFELIGGPDVFFHVHLGTTPLLLEPASTGRAFGRENVEHCSFHELCVEAPSWTPDQVTLWTQIGNYRIPDSASLHDFDADGLVSSGKLAFTGNIDLNGQLSQKFAGQAVSYRFLRAEWSDLATPPSYPADYQALVAPNLNLNRPYGSLYVQTGPSPWDFTTTPVLPEPDSDGWIAVNQSANFVRDTSTMVQVRTETLVPSVDSSGAMTGIDNAGLAVPAGPLRDRPRKFSFMLEIKTASLSAHQSTPATIHINNSSAYMRHNLAELESNGCTAISSAGGSISVHSKFTVAHPYLHSYSLQLQRQGGTTLTVRQVDYTTGGALWTPTTGEFGEEVPVYTDVGKCSYRSTLTATRRLTNGYGGPGHQTILRTFCVD